MGWTTERNSQNVVNVNLLGMKKDDKKELYGFEVFKGYGDTKELIAEKAYSIKGKLQKIDLGGYDYTDETGKPRHNKTMTFILNDGENIIKYGTGYNMVSRQIVYCLASIEGKIGEVELMPYISKKGYKSIWVKNNGEDVRMVFDFEKDIKSKCKYSEEFQKTSYVELDKWIDETLIPKINSNIAFENKDLDDIVNEEPKEEVFDDLPFN